MSGGAAASWAMPTSLARLVARRHLLFMLTWREIRIKYKQSLIGMLWAVLMPALIISAGILVRAGAAMLSGTHLETQDVAAVSVKAVPWAFFVASVRFATNSLIANANLVTKVYFPREIFPIAAMLSQFVDFAVASLVLVVVLAILHVGIGPEVVWVPLLVLILVLFTTGLGILLSAGSLFFRDVKYLVEVVLTFAIFFTPVFYDVRTFGRWAPYLMLNPLAPLFEGFVDVIVRHTGPSVAWLGYSAAVALVTLVTALWGFRRLEPYFAESV